MDGQKTQRKLLQRSAEDIRREEERLPPKPTKEEIYASYRFEEREIKRAHKKMHAEVMKGKHKTLLSFFVDSNGLATKNHDKKKKNFLCNQKARARRLQTKYSTNPPNKTT